VPRASFHLGTHVTKFTRIAANVVEPGGGSVQGKQHALLWCGLDGSVGLLSPLPESSFRRLSFLATKMTVSVPHPAGLHPRAFRSLGARVSSARELKSIVRFGGRFYLHSFGTRRLTLG
jgi:cleavage and polyadenylation specificity factor subunit 1